MPATTNSDGSGSKNFSSLRETPEDLEKKAVAGKLQEGQKYTEKELGRIVDDHLDDSLVPPLDMIAQLLQKMVPKVVATAKKQLDSCLSKLPFSAILHLLLIETMTVWIFYYSVYNTSRTVIMEAAYHMNADKEWPNIDLVNECLAEHARRLLWNDGHLHPSECFDAATVELHEDAELDSPPVMAMINMGCLLLCLTLWLVVLGSFIRHTSCHVWVRYNSGLYLQSLFFTRRSWPYRVVCGFLGFCGFLGICGLMAICLNANILGWFLSSQLTNVLVVLISARSFLAPTKPKFEYGELHELNFKRSSFFQTNGAFAVALSDALIQSARGSKFRGSLKKLLANEEDWDLALQICFIGKTNESPGNKALLKLWGAAVDNLPKAAKAAEDHGSTMMQSEV